MNLASHRTHLSYPSFQRGVSWIAAIVATLAFFLVFASLLLASYPIGSAVRGYFYGLTDVQNDAGIHNQLSGSEIANFSGKSNAIDVISDHTEVISGNGTNAVTLQTSGMDAIVENTWRNSSEDKHYANLSLDKVALNSSSGSEPEVPESVHIAPSKYNISSDNGCDLYDGRWVHDPSGPLYTNNTCPILTQMQNCQGNGRPDKDYENWRWKPSKCQLPRFDANKFLQLMKGKTLAFIGDSVARNQMESLLCILWQVETPKNRGNRRMQRWYFRSSSTFIVRIWSSWLVHQTSDRLDHTPEGVTKVHLDEPDRTLMEFLPTFDVAVLSSGHWFAKQSVYVVGGGIVGGQLWWPDKSVAMKVNNVEAFGISVETVLTALVTHPNYTGLTIVRSYSPDHYQGGTWNTGGSCTGKVKPATPDEITENGFTKAMYEKQVKGFEKAEKRQKNRSVLRLMDITKAFSYRVDGHPGPYRNKDPKKVTVAGKDGRPPPQDCLHWCMPGPVDTWNELVMEILRRGESVSSSSYLF